MFVELQATPVSVKLPNKGKNTVLSAKVINLNM